MAARSARRAIQQVCLRKIKGPAGELVKLAAEEGTLYLRKGFFYDSRSTICGRRTARIAPRPLLVAPRHADEWSLPEAANADAASEPKRLIMTGATGFLRTRRWSGAAFNWLERYFVLQQKRLPLGQPFKYKNWLGR